MSQFSQYEWEDPFAQPPRRNRGPVLLIVLLLGGVGSLFLIAFVAIVIGVARHESQFDDNFAAAGDLNSDAPARPIDWEQTRQAFDPDAPRPDAETLARFQPLIDEFVRCSNEGDQAGLRKIVDFKRFFREMKATRFAPDIALYDQQALYRQLVEDVRGMSGWDSVRIVAVAEGARRGESTVFAYGISEGCFTFPLRFWVAAGRRPKLFDWQVVEYGVRETDSRAIAYAYDNDWRRTNREAGLQEVERAEEHWSASEEETAKAALRSAMGKQTPPPLHDEYLTNIAFTWLAWGEYEQVHAICSQMKNMDHAPGSHFVEAKAYQAEARYEDALRAIEKYESLVGCTPESLDLQARTCQQLERFDEAKGHYAKLLKVLPDDPAALDAWARLLDDDEQHLLAAHLDRLDNVVEVATAMAARRSYDSQIVAALSDVIEQHAPHAPIAAFLRGVKLQSDGQFEQAAAAYQQFIETSQDEQQVTSARYRYVGCMIDAGQAQAAYEQSDDPQFVFDYLVGDYEEDGALIPYDELVQIVDRQLQQFPDDPWNYYYASLIKDGGESTDLAEGLLRQGLNKTDPEQDAYAVESLKRRLVELLFRDGRGLQAYQTIAPAAETFKRLADLHRWSDRPDGEFQELLRLHAVAQPADPWLPYYQAVAQQKAGHLAQAERLLAAATNRRAVQDDEELAAAYRSLWLDVLMEQKRYVDAYRRVRPTTEAFDAIARHLHDEQNWGPLSTILTLHRAQYPQDARGLLWAVRMYWAKKDYAGIAAALVPTSSGLDKLESWERSEVQLLLVRSLLRTGQIEWARRAAEETRRSDGELLPLIIVHVAAGEDAPAAQLIDQYAHTAYRMDNLYDDEDIGPALRDAKYAAVRRRHPPDLPSEYGSAAGVVFFDAPPEFTLAQAKRLAAEFLGQGATVRAIPADVDEDGDDEHAGAYLLSDATRRMVVSFGDDVYQADVDLRGQGVRDKELRDRYGRQQGWISIDVLEVDDVDGATGLLHKMIASLLDEHAILVNVEPGWLLPGGEPTRRRLQAGDTESNPSDAQIWLYREAAASEAERNWRLRRERYLRQLDKMFAQRKERQKFHLLVTLAAGDAHERIWLRLDRVKRGGNSDRSFVAVFEQPSALFPKIQAGDYVAVKSYQVDNWRMTQGGNMVYGRDPE